MQAEQLQKEVEHLNRQQEQATERAEALLEIERSKTLQLQRKHAVDLDSARTWHTQEVDAADTRCAKAEQRASMAEENMLSKVRTLWYPLIIALLFDHVVTSCITTSCC